MRKAYLTLAENNGGNVQSGRGKTAQWPGVSTMSLEKVSRMTTHRLYAKQAHIKKMLAVYGMLLIVVRLLRNTKLACRLTFMDFLLVVCTVSGVSLIYLQIGGVRLDEAAHLDLGRSQRLTNLRLSVS